jgi:Rrf2 family protein
MIITKYSLIGLAQKMKLSRRGEYAIKALQELALADPASGSTTALIASRARIPEPFLNQIMLTLKNAGLVRSRRGAHGGYILSRPPATIFIGEIARSVDGPLAPIPCASVTAYEPCPTCPEPQSCNLQLLMRRVRDAIADILDQTTLADLVASAKSAPAANLELADILSREAISPPPLNSQKKKEEHL